MPKIYRILALSGAMFAWSIAPASATIYMNTVGWTEDSMQWEWNGFSDVPMWVNSWTSSDDPECPYLGVQTEFHDPYGNPIGGSYADGYCDASAYLTYYDNPENGADGDYVANSEHWDINGTIDFSLFGFGAQNVQPRWALDPFNPEEIRLDPGGQICWKRYHYLNDQCYGYCQSATAATDWFPGFQGYENQPCTTIDPTQNSPRPYMYAKGKHWWAWFYNACSLRGYGTFSRPECIGG